MPDSFCEFFRKWYIAMGYLDFVTFDDPEIGRDSVGKAILGLRGFGAGCIGFRCLR